MRTNIYLNLNWKKKIGNKIKIFFFKKIRLSSQKHQKQADCKRREKCQRVEIPFGTCREKNKGAGANY